MKRLCIAAIAVAGLTLAGCGEVAAPVKKEGSAEVTSDSPSPTAKVKPTAKIGDTVTVGAWDVKVTGVQLQANQIIHQANEFNDKPAGQYVLVNYEATYNGEERIADTIVDLSWSFTGTDAKVHNETDAVTPADSDSWPTEARKGGTVKGQAVFDLPPALIKGGTLTVEGMDESFDTVFADFIV